MNCTITHKIVLNKQKHKLFDDIVKSMLSNDYNGLNNLLYTLNNTDNAKKVAVEIHQDDDNSGSDNDEEEAEEAEQSGSDQDESEEESGSDCGLDDISDDDNDIDEKDLNIYKKKVAIENMAKSKSAPIQPVKTLKGLGQIGGMRPDQKLNGQLKKLPLTGLPVARLQPNNNIASKIKKDVPCVMCFSNDKMLGPFKLLSNICNHYACNLCYTDWTETNGNIKHNCCVVCNPSKNR